MVEVATADLVARYSKPIDAFIQAADRTRYESSLFDMRRRTLLGQYALADHLVWFLQEVTSHVPAAELARSMRRLASIPYGQLIHAMPWSYLVPRENDIALGRWPRGEGLNDDALAWLMDTWAEMAIAYYDTDELVLPSEAGNTQRFLPDAEIAVVQDLLDEAPHDIADAQRAVARLEMLNFVISGEIRGRNYFHGPYPSRSPDAYVVVQEFAELKHRHQPWVQDELLGYPIDNVVCIRELSGVELSFDLFGFAVVVGGGSYRSHIRRTALVTVEDGAPRPLTAAELEDLGQRTKRSIQGAYAQFATWDDDFRIAYGAYHYLTEASGYAELAGVPELVGELRSRMEASIPERLAEVRAMGDVAPVWARWREGRGFSPPA